MASGLALPFVIVPDPETGAPDPEAVQSNFEAIKKEFPLSRKNVKLESPHVVGDSGEPAFQNSWVNYDTTAFRGARFWKDPMGLVHIEGLVKSGTVPGTVFSLPAGYRPGVAHVFTSDTNTGHGRVDVAATGNVVAQSGGNGYFSLSTIPPFKQEG